MRRHPAWPQKQEGGKGGAWEKAVKNYTQREKHRLWQVGSSGLTFPGIAPS
jgi:hypothetical protein